MVIRILRIAFLLPFYAIISYICILAPTADVYLAPWLDFVQSISLGTFFLLICEFVVPEGHSRNAWFSEFSFPDKKSPTGKGDGLRWFRVRNLLFFYHLPHSTTSLCLSIRNYRLFVASLLHYLLSFLVKVRVKLLIISIPDLEILDFCLSVSRCCTACRHLHRHHAGRRCLLSV